jgi:hypothetical protein
LADTTDDITNLFHNCVLPQLSDKVNPSAIFVEADGPILAWRTYVLEGFVGTMWVTDTKLVLNGKTCYTFPPEIAPLQTAHCPTALETSDSKCWQQGIFTQYLTAINIFEINFERYMKRFRILYRHSKEKHQQGLSHQWMVNHHMSC